MELLDKIDNALAGAERMLVVAVFALLVALVFLGIVARNLFQASFESLFETAPAAVLWLALLGASLALRENRHIRLSFLLNRLSPRWQRVAKIGSAFFGGLVMGVLLVASIRFVTDEVSLFGDKGFAAVIFPLFFATTTFRYLLSALRLARSRKATKAVAP